MKRERQQGGDIISVERHNRDFVMIDNSAVQDPNLSLKATGLLSLLISYPSNWKISLSHLCGVKPDGRDSILSGLAELSQSGYLLYLRWRDAGGLWSSRYIVFETPQLKEKYLEQMPKEDVEKITDPFSPSKAKAKKQKLSQETTTENPQWNHNGKTVTENPSWKNRNGEPDPDKYIDTNTNQKNVLERSPLTPQGGTGCLSEEGEGENLTGGGEERSPKPVEPPQAIQQGAPEQKSILSEDQISAAPTPIYSVHKKEHQARIVEIYQSNKPSAWLPVNNLHRDIRVMVDSLLSSENFQGDLEAFLTRLENALKEINDPTTKFGWFRNQGNLGLRTLLSNYGRHLMEFSDRWMERQTPQVRSDVLPDWALEAQKEIEARQTKKAG
jgi:hypothetical protein